MREKQFAARKTGRRTQVGRKALAVSLLFLIAYPGLATANTPVPAGTILQDTKWGPGVYVLNGTVSVAPGATLTISPGATVLMGDYSSGLLVAGNLVAVGTISERITFSSLNQASAGSYAAAQPLVLSNSAGSQIEYATIENAMYGLSLDGYSTLTIKNTLFQNNYLAITDSYGYQPMDVQHNTFVGNYSAFGGIRTSGESRFNFNVFKDNTNVFEYGYYLGLTDVSFNSFEGSTLVMRSPVVGYGYGVVTMMDNWWGTADNAAIEDLIYDQHDLGTLQRISYSATSGPIESAGIMTSVPEPETYAMLLAGLVMVGGAARLRRR